MAIHDGARSTEVVTLLILFSLVVQEIQSSILVNTNALMILVNTNALMNI